MRDVRTIMHDAAVAAAWAGALSGIPSTIHALATRTDPLEPTRAAGSILMPDEARTSRLVGAAAVVHGGLSLGWAVPLAAVLPRRRTVLCGLAAGLAIAALDLELIGRRFPRIRALRQLPQWADHALYGAVVGWVVHRRRGSGE